MHRLVDEIPDTHPEVARVLFELTFLLIVEANGDGLRFRGLLRDLDEAQMSSKTSEDLLSALKDLRNRWVHGRMDTDSSLPPILASAPEDDEPLTSEEAALLTERRVSGPTIPHDELYHQLRA